MHHQLSDRLANLSIVGGVQSVSNLTLTEDDKPVIIAVHLPNDF
jgi:hypothetical protein